MNFLELLSKLPPEAYDAFGRLLSALLSGDAEQAEKEARVAAETVASKAAIDAAYEAGVKARG